MKIYIRNYLINSFHPGEWVINDFTRDYVANHGCKQNKNLDFSGTKRDYSDGTSRWLSESLFLRKLINGKKSSTPMAHLLS